MRMQTWKSQASPRVNRNGQGVPTDSALVVTTEAKNLISDIKQPRFFLESQGNMLFVGQA